MSEETNTTQGNTQPDQLPKAAETPVLVQPVHADNDAPISESEQTESSSFEEIVSVLEKPREKAKWTDIAIVILTGGIVFLAGMQWWEMHDSGKQTDKIIAADQRVAGAMENAVLQASNSFTTTIDQFRLEQRAWVGVFGVDPVDFENAGGPIVSVVFFNSGKTPARNVKVSVGFAATVKPITGPSAENVKALEFKSGQSIAPQGRYNLIAGLRTSGTTATVNQLLGRQNIAERLSAIKTGQLNLYYFGILKYDDAFGGHRETRYCLYVADYSKKQMGFCDAFNDLY